MPRKHRHVIRPVRVDGALAYVTLSQGQVVTIDASDVSIVEGYNWTTLFNGSSNYAARYCVHPDGKRKPLLLHRAILNAQPGQEIDHANRDTLDNRRCNLRFCTKSQNQANKSTRNKTGFKGVCFHAQSGKWNARIKKDRKYQSLGYYHSAEEAGAVYAAVAKVIHGEFACTNDP